MKKIPLSILTFLILNLIMVGLVAGGFWWLLREEGKLLARAKELIGAERKKENLERFLRIYGQTEAGRTKVSSYFITTETLPQFIERLEQAARETGVIYTLSNTKPAEVSGREVLNLTIATEGNFAQVYRFIYVLENLPYRLDINQAYLGPMAAGRWRANFDLTLFSFK
ncbi:MAG: hypothetical protein AAB589_00775 [Patescibacteria group bacterium]